MNQLTVEERALIMRIFPNSNVDMKTGSGEYLFPCNAHAFHGRAHLSFYKNRGHFRVVVAHHASEKDALDPRVVPITHTDHAATEQELEWIKRDVA